MSTHILVINHSPDILDLFEAVLEPEGYIITTQLFAQRSVEDVALAQPDVLICDYPAICETEAWAFVQLLKDTAATTTIPVLVSTTSLTLVRDHQAWLTAHDIAVLPKPFAIDDLLTVLHRLAGTAAPPLPACVHHDADMCTPQPSTC